MPSGVKDIQLLELKDTISQLNKTISTQNELISSLQKMLEERNAKDSEKDLLIANLQSQLAYLKNKVFGSTSEIRHDQLDGQRNGRASSATATRCCSSAAATNRPRWSLS